MWLKHDLVTADCERYNHKKNISRMSTFRVKAVRLELDKGPSLATPKFCLYICHVGYLSQIPIGSYFKLSYLSTLAQTVQILSALNSSNIRVYCNYCRKHICRTVIPSYCTINYLIAFAMHAPLIFSTKCSCNVGKNNITILMTSVNVLQA
jgi:hypothetical protein